jgi:hypothetical protein
MEVVQPPPRAKHFFFLALWPLRVAEPAMDGSANPHPPPLPTWPGVIRPNMLLFFFSIFFFKKKFLIFFFEVLLF